MQDFISLGLSGNNKSSMLREKVIKKFHLGYGNAKTVLKRLNMLGVTLKELEEIIYDSK